MEKARKPQYFTTIKEFKFIENKQIGKGSFGEVRPAIHILTNKVYAVKIIDSNEITTQIGVKALERETSIHPSIDHPHIIKLWQVLQEDSKIYMVMEFAEKGNLFYYQNKRKVLSEEEVFNFFTQTLSAIEYMHNLNIVHRDLKPENLLLDKDLNIKICDLGWVVEGIQDRHTTFCGTYEYMAPEMIFNGEYDFRVDIWALGVLLYEMLHGFAPFEGDKADEVRKSMLNGEIHIDPELSESSQDLIFNILKVQPDERLTISEIKSHEWINEMKNKKANVFIPNSDHSNRESSEKLQQNKGTNYNEIDHLKGLSKRLMEIMKQNKKSPSQIKNNFSAEQLNIRKSLKEKGDLGKQVRESSGKKIFGYHHTQNLSVSEIAKKQRLKTETNEKSFRPEIIRFNTEMGENTICENRTIKKKKIPQKNVPFAANLLKTAQKHKLVRKSID